MPVRTLIGIGQEVKNLPALFMKNSTAIAHSPLRWALQDTAGQSPLLKKKILG
jgi:hypothetical protein